MLSINTFREKIEKKHGPAPVNRYTVYIPGRNNEYARLSVTFAYRKWEQITSGAANWTSKRVQDFLTTGDTSRGF